MTSHPQRCYLRTAVIRISVASLLMVAPCWITPAAAGQPPQTEAPVSIPATKRELLEKLFVICDMKAHHDASIVEVFDGAITLQAKLIPENMKAGFNEGLAKIRKLTLETAGWDAIKERMLALHAAEFSEQELRDAITAMDNPAVRNFFAKRTLLAVKTARILQQDSEALQQKVATIMTEAMLAKPAAGAEGAKPKQRDSADDEAAQEIRGKVSEFAGLVMKQAKMGEPTKQEKAKLDTLANKCAGLAQEGDRGGVDAGMEKIIMLELPLCFDAERQQRFRNGLIQLMEETKGEVQMSRAKIDIMSLSSSLRIYKLNCGVYPTTEQGLAALAVKPTSQPVPAQWQQALSQIPKDPWGNSYGYRMPGKRQPAAFDLFSNGPDGKEGTEDDVVVE